MRIIQGYAVNQGQINRYLIVSYKRAKEKKNKTNEDLHQQTAALITDNTMNEDAI